MNLLKIKSVNTGLKEKVIEEFLCKQIKRLGGIPYKFSAPGRRHVPDRLCVMPKGVIIFIECKRPGGVPSKAQGEELRKIKNLGHIATYVATKEDVMNICDNLKELLKEE